MKKSARYFLSCLLATSTLLITNVVIAEPPCASLSPQNGELGYQPRTNRCEGLFVQEVTSNVRLTSILITSSPILPLEEDRLQVKLSSKIPAAKYQLRISSLDPRVHYQLDAFISPDFIFSWPRSDVISKIPISLSDLAPLGWSISDPGYYVPVLFHSTAQPETQTITVIIESTVPVQQFSARLVPENNSKKVILKLTPELRLPATLLKFNVPKNTHGMYTLWLRTRLLGENEPDSQHWTIWLP